MRRALVHLAGWLALLSAGALLFGGWSARGDRLTLKVIPERRLVSVIVGLPDVDERYRWLSVYGCSAAMGIDNPATFCTGEFERESSFEVSERRQYLVYWRDMPRGMLLVTAMAFDANQKALAQHTTTVFR